MGDLKDQLLKSGLISEARAKKLAHSETSRRKKLGKAGVSRERDLAVDARRAREEARRRADRQRAARDRSEEEIAEERNRLRQILQPFFASKPWRGRRRFHFVARDGKKILFLEVSDDASKKLERGEFAICEIPNLTPSAASPEGWTLVPREKVSTIREVDPDAILFFNSAPR